MFMFGKFTGKRAELVVAVGLDIRSITTDGSHLKRFVEESTKNAVAVDLFLAKRFMFWADAFLNKIFRSNFDTSIAKPLVVATINGLKDLAVDWITGKLYWLSTYLQSTVQCFFAGIIYLEHVLLTNCEEYMCTVKQRYILLHN